MKDNESAQRSQTEDQVVSQRQHRLEAKIDAHFNRQTVLMTVLGVPTLFGDTIRGLLGL